MFFLWKILFFQQSCFRVHFALSTTGGNNKFLMEFLLTGYRSFYKFLSADLPNSDFHSFYNFLFFQKSHFLANFPRFRPLKISFFQIEISTMKHAQFKQFLFDILRAEEESDFSSLAFHILKSRCKCFDNRFTFVL